MADLVVPTGFGLWTFYMQHTGIQHTAVCTLGFEVATPPYTSTNCANALSAWATNMAALHDSEVVYSRCVALIGNDGPPLRFEAVGTGTGSRSLIPIAPPNVTYLARKVTSFAGRRYRGRMYIPYVSNAGINQTGTLTSAELTILTARLAATVSALVAAGPNAASLRLLHASSPLSATPTPTACVLQADDFVATQRRRLERQ